MKQTVKELERFYTHAKCQDEASGLVDLVCIDVVNKEYLFYQEVDDAETDGEDENGNEICAVYVSREVFDIILQGLKTNKYKQLKN